MSEQGITAEVILMRNIITTPALNNGDIDYLTAIPHSVRGAIVGLPVKIVACYLPSASLMVVSRREINSVKELRGETVAVSGIGSTNFTALQLIAKHFGLNPEKEIKVLAVGGSERPLGCAEIGLSRGDSGPAPVGLSWEKKLGFHVIARSYEFFNYPQVGLIANQKKIKEQGDEIKRVIKAGIKANRYIRSNREGTIQFLMEWMKIDKEVAAATYEAFLPAFSEDGNLPEDGMQIVIDEAKKAANVNRVIALRDVTDLSILKKAQRELGIIAR